MNKVVQRTVKSDTIVATGICFSGEAPEWEEIAITAMAVQNIYLTCTTYGIGCYWGTLGPMFQVKDFS